MNFLAFYKNEDPLVVTSGLLLNFTDNSFYTLSCINVKYLYSHSILRVSGKNSFERTGLLIMNSCKWVFFIDDEKFMNKPPGRGSIYDIYVLSNRMIRSTFTIFYQ